MPRPRKPFPLQLIPLTITTFVALNVHAATQAQAVELNDSEVFDRGRNSAREYLARTPEPTIQVSTVVFAKAKQFQAELDSQNSDYLSSQAKLCRTLQEAIGRVPVSIVSSDFRYERKTIDALKTRAAQLSADAHAIILAIDAHRTVGRSYVAILGKAPPTYQGLAQQFRQFASVEAYADRKEDYLVFASIFEGLAKRYQAATSNVEPDMKAINELYPYLQSTEQLLTRVHTALDLLPSESYGDGGPGIEAQLRRFVESFNGFRGAVRSLNERLGGDGQKAPNPTNANDWVARQGGVGRPSAPTGAPDSRPSPATLRPAPNAWLASAPPAHRNVLVFHLSGNDPLRHEVFGEHVQEGEVYPVRLHTGRQIVLRVRRKMPSIGTPDVWFWLAEPTTPPPTVATAAVASRP